MVQLIAALIQRYAGSASRWREVERLWPDISEIIRHQSKTSGQSLIPIKCGSCLQRFARKLGYCLPPQEQERIASNPALTVYEFTEAVFVAEGDDPSSANKKMLNDVRTVIAAAFAKSSLPFDDET